MVHYNRQSKDNSRVPFLVTQTPHGPTPTPRQLRQHTREFYGFIHFTVNTFTDKEWGFGDESPALFNPTDFDADEITQVAARAGMAGLILTCKHHDGFCLWPTQTTAHSVAASPFRGGQGDVVREMSDACRQAGIEFGVYLSPWDRNSALYGTPEYVTQVYRPQLRELLTDYGPLFEVWFDGANGGDGYYGGARETRRIDPAAYYGWPETWEIVRELQPDAVMFSDVGPDVRWVGNEDGIAGDPCWATLTPGSMTPGVADQKRLNRGDRDGDTWLIPECDVSLRPGWFWHENETHQVRSARNLSDLYFQSVGRGATLLLNLTPDRRGRIPEEDKASLKAFRAHLDATFGHYLAGDAALEPAPTDGLHTAREIMLTLPVLQTVNAVRLRERLELGQRIDAWELDAEQDDGWQTVVRAEAVGAQRLVRFPDVMADRFRLRITKTSAEPPVLSEIALFFEPVLNDEQAEGTEKETTREALSVTQPDPTTLVFDLGASPPALTGLTYTPDVERGQVADGYAISVSDGGQTWREIARGEFANVRSNPIPQRVSLAVPTGERFLRFQATRFAAGNRVEMGQVSLLEDVPSGIMGA